MNQVSFTVPSKQRGRIDLREITVFVIAITIFLSIDPFFAWPSFAGGIGVTIFKVLQIASMVLMLLQLLSRKIPSSALLAGVSIMGLFFFYCFFTGVKSGTTHPLLIGNVLVYLFYALSVMSDKELLLRSYELLRTIFAVFLGYTLIIHVLLLIGVPFPYTVLQSGEAGRAELTNQFYQNYFGCLLINQGGQLLYRFTSVFTEPGVVGTFCAFFLAASGCNVRKSKKDLLFLISGLFSLSVAFYIMLVIIYAMKAFRSGGYRLFACLIALVVVYAVFVNVKFSDPSLVTLQERLTITEDGLAGDNRIDEMAEASYRAFLDSDMKTVLLGYGSPDLKATELAWQKTASYKETVYHIGVLGYGLMLAWFILVPLTCYKTKNRQQNWMMYSYMVIFLISQYQRPYTKSLFLVYILLAGCLFARERAKAPLPIPFAEAQTVDDSTFKV